MRDLSSSGGRLDAGNNNSAKFGSRTALKCNSKNSQLLFLLYFGKMAADKNYAVYKILQILQILANLSNLNVYV